MVLQVYDNCKETTNSTTCLIRHIPLIVLFLLMPLMFSAKGHMVNKLITRTFSIGKLMHVYSLSLSLSKTGQHHETI